jgi:hypothetical protein
VTVYGYAQCEYADIKYDRSTKLLFLKQFPITLDVFETPYNGRIIKATMMRIGDNYTIDLEITTDSNARELEPVCFKEGSKLSFALKSNKIVTLLQKEEIICGIKQSEPRSTYNTVSNYARFIITQEAYDDLKKEEIILMKIISEDYTKTFVLKSELEDVKDGEIVITNPTRFFMDNIDCLTHPKFN